MFNLDQIIKTLQTDPNAQRTAMIGAGGLAAGLLLGRGGIGGLAKAGAIAAIGGLAYNAWQNHQRNQQVQGQPSRDAFVPPTGAAAEEELGKSLVRAMIAAAKADGQIDASEKDRIFRKLESMPLSAEEKAFVFDELSAPLDIDAVVSRADTPEHATEIYAASLVAMSPDTPEEEAYLKTLAGRLNLAAELVAEIHKSAAAAAPATTRSGTEASPIGL
jgi:uncharacterized membrane protein YebE (DUF533 family)